MKADKKAPATVNQRGRGPYNVACDVCARKKTKCDGIKPVCQPCQNQGRQKECGWAKNPARKPRTEAYVEAMHKQAENLRKCMTDIRHYADYLESLLDECYKYQQHRTVDFRASRPPDPDVLLGQPEDDFDFTMMGGDDNDQGSDDGNDPTVMAICIPPQSLQVEPFTQPSRFPALAENPDATYVLLVDGVQPSHYNAAFDWSRYLPTNVPLDRPSHDKALDLLFKFFTSWCLRIIPALFLRDMYRALSIPPSQTPPKTPHYSPMLHNALVALALAFLDEPFRDFKTRQYYATHAKSFIEAECRKPNLSVVHALSVIASFHSSQGDQTLGYMYFGMSARISQALGLNIDCSDWVKLGLMDEAERLDRHWANWTSFAQDVCWSLYVGRDFCVAEPVGAKATPMPHIDPEFDEMPWFYPPAEIAPQPNNLTKSFEATCRLLMIARRIMDVINGLNKVRSRPLVLDALISDIDVQLNMWKSSLSEELDITPRSLLTATPHKLMLHLAYWWLFILLHRPFFHRKSRSIHSMDREIDHVKLCRRAAEHIMELLSTWRTLYKLRYCPITLIQTAFSAGTVYLLVAMQASSGTRIAEKELRHSLDQETLVQQYLQEIGLSWNCATNISSTLRNLMNDQVRPLLDILDRKSNSIATAGLLVSADIGDDEEENGSSSRSSSRKRSYISQTEPRQVSQPRIIASGSGQSFLSTPPKYTLTYLTSLVQVSPSLAKPSNSPTFKISPPREPSSTHAASSAPIAIRSQRSPSPNSSTFHTGLQPSPGSSPNFNYLPSFAHRNFRGYSQLISNYMDDPFSGNGHGSNEDVGHAFGGQDSFLDYTFQPSSSNHHVGGYLMLGGQTLSDTPFVVGPFGSEVDIHSLHLPDFLQAPFGNGFLNHESSSLGEHVPSSSSHGGMDIDSVPWGQPFAS